MATGAVMTILPVLVVLAVPTVATTRHKYIPGAAKACWVNCLVLVAEASPKFQLKVTGPALFVTVATTAKATGHPDGAFVATFEIIPNEYGPCATLTVPVANVEFFDPSHAA